jgi:formylglycine-generating enzyme required for sulfatase activity
MAFALYPGFLRRCLASALLLFAALSSLAQTADKRNLAVGAASPAFSEKRVALVIGNSAYVNSPLRNPLNDAADMAARLRSLGFEVVLRSNLSTRQIGGTLREFRSKLSPGAVALVFYAGHGLQIKGENYLPTVDADINSEEDVPNQSISMRQLMDVLDEAKTRLNLVFLDACRNNPYARSFRSSDQGLARISAPSGTLISYATRPGSVAADGTGRNGLYTGELLKQMQQTQAPIEQVLKRVVSSVKSGSQGKQEPWMEGSIEGDFCFGDCGQGVQTATLAPAPANAAPSRPLPAAPAQDAETQLWNEVKTSGSRDYFDAYLKQYPKGKYVVLVQVEIQKINEAERAAQEMRPGKVFKDCADCPELVVLPAGSFEMGSSDGNADEKPVHSVQIKSFSMGTTEVTQAQWQTVMGSNPSDFKNCGVDCPVENVSWDDAQEFIKRLNAKTSKTYRLPSEAEWEFACRAGGRHEYCGSDDINSVAWYGAYANPVGNSQKSTNPVKRKQANAFGLYDMSGNVWEWVQDCWNNNYNRAPSDGSAWQSGNCSVRVLRGGSWNISHQFSLAATRGRETSSIRYISSGGLRLARTLP